MSLNIHRQDFFLTTEAEKLLEKLDELESKASLLKENSSTSEQQSEELNTLDFGIKEINKSGNANLNIEKMKQIYFIKCAEKIADGYNDLIKTVNPFISDEIQGRLTCDELLERIVTAKSKVKFFMSYECSPFVKGLSGEVLINILSYVPIHEVAPICKTWRRYSLGVCDRQWQKILEHNDVPSDMKEGMQALQRLFPKDHGLVLIYKFFTYYEINSSKVYLKNLRLNFKEMPNDFIYIHQLSVEQLKEKMVTCFNARKDHDLMLLWKHIDCLKLKSIFHPTTAKDVREIMQHEENQEQLKVVTGIYPEIYYEINNAYHNSNVTMHTIPPEIIYLPNVKEICAEMGNFKRDISLNIYLISLPTQICELCNLEQLDLSGNDLTELPKNIGNLKQLKKINLHRNKLIDLPESFSQLSKLKELHLLGNALDFTAIEKICNLSSLVILELTSLGVRELPAAFCNLVCLQRLDLDSEELCKLPENMGDLKKLRVLKLCTPKLTELPQSFTHLDSLRLLTILKHNLSTIRLPASFGSTEWIYLQLSKSPSLIRFSPFDFSSNPNLLASQNVLQQIKREREFITQSPLGLLYRHILHNDVLEEEQLKPLVSSLSQSDQNLLFEMIWVCAGCPKTDDLQWGEHNCFNFKALGEDVFVRAVHQMISEKYNRLAKEQKNGVEGQIYILAGRPSTKDQEEWGKRNALDIRSRLADAMELVSDQF